MHHHPAIAILILSFLHGGEDLFAQGFLNDHVTWNEEYVLYEGSTAHHSVFTLWVDGDTLISGVQYKRIRQLGTDTVGQLGSTAPPVIVPLDRYLGAIREDVDLNRWWVVFNGGNSEQLLFDFDLTLGQPLSGTFGDCSEGYMVQSIDSVLMVGQWRKRFHIGPWGRYHIEGVGASSGLFGYLCPFIEEYGCLNSYAVGKEEYIVDGCGQLITGTNTLADPSPTPVYPNPTDGPCYFSADLIGRQAIVLDAAGRQVVRSRIATNGVVDLSGLRPGTYMIRVQDQVHRVERR